MAAAHVHTPVNALPDTKIPCELYGFMCSTLKRQAERVKLWKLELEVP